jgi:hypothetical protein
MMPYYQDMQQQYPIYLTSDPLQMSQAFITEAPQDLDPNFPYLQSYDIEFDMSDGNHEASPLDAPRSPEGKFENSQDKC